MIEEQTSEQMTLLDWLGPGSWCGKTFPEPSAATTEKTFGVCSRRPRELSSVTPMFLDLRGGVWSNSGAIVGYGWSIAWRLHNSEFWGVPQRRKRVSLVVDFGGESAPSLLFEREEVQEHYKTRAKERETDTASVPEGPERRYRFFENHNQDGRYNEMFEVSNTIVTKSSQHFVVETHDGETKIRTFTPLELEREQGFPDGWTNIGDWTDSKGKIHKESDSARYKALGNSIALPFWEWLAKRIAAQYDRPATMASLFDGIGGFPLCFQRAGVTPVWASEIEEFPIAVTKIRFPEE